MGDDFRPNEITGVMVGAKQIEDEFDHPGEHLAARKSGGVAHKERLHLGEAFKEPQVNLRSDIAKPLGRELQARLDRVRVQG
jgi:hypothetical protein